MKDTLRTLLTRDLEKLKTELASYQTEANIWRTDKKITNSAGNLALHLIGNLNTYIGSILGQTGYIRDRPAEFASKDIPRTELLERVDHSIAVIEAVLPGMTDEQLQSSYPQDVGKGDISTEYFLVHLAMHLSYHLGQVNYHRRLLD